MDKDKLRSVVTVGMLACILVFSALFMGCPQPTWQQKVQVAQAACPHNVKAAYYHHDPNVPPHDSIVAKFDFCKPSPPLSIGLNGTPSPQPCPVPDAAICEGDSVKCTACGAKLWVHP
jgi:hypothetical protein